MAPARTHWDLAVVGAGPAGAAAAPAAGQRVFDDLVALGPGRALAAPTPPTDLTREPA